MDCIILMRSQLYFSSLSPCDMLLFEVIAVFGFSIFLGMSSWVFVFVLVYFSWFYWFAGWYFSSNLGNFQLLFLQIFFFPAPLSSLSSWHLNCLYIGLLDIVLWITGGSLLCCFFFSANKKTYSFYLEIISTYTKMQEYYGKNPTLTLLRFTYCYCFTPVLFLLPFYLSLYPSIHLVYIHTCVWICVCIYIYNVFIINLRVTCNHHLLYP